jgi:hypothetical protein
VKKSLALTGLLAAMLAFAAQAQNQTYAPQLADAVVLQDSVERDFSPQLFHSVLGEVLNMKMDASCTQVRVVGSTVNCISSEGHALAVGSLTKESRPMGEWSAITVKWSDKVEVREGHSALGLTYSLIVK